MLSTIYFLYNPSASFHSAPPLTQGRQDVKEIKYLEKLLAPPAKGERATKWRGGYFSTRGPCRGEEGIVF